MPAIPALALLPLLLAAPGDTPPPGPPWRLTYAEARTAALAAGQPVFVYFTKTH